MNSTYINLNRRAALAAFGALAGGMALAPISFAQTSAKVVVVGGGFGGASAAGQLKALLPNLQVTLVEPNPIFSACPFSNLVIAGLRDIEDQQFGYDGLKARGVNIAQTSATNIDPNSKTVTLSDGGTLSYDRLILSPGISIRWDALEGYDEAAASKLPHAWKAGEQTLLLRDQLQAMPNGGTVVMTVPPAPFRCPPGPYERASLIANYLKTEKPKSKLIMLDSNERFSKMPLFQAAWEEHYSDVFERRGPALDRVSRVNADTRTVSTDFDDIQGDVVNVIPPQRAGEIALIAGVADQTGWCPIKPITFESALVPGIHVIGDATIAAPMPKSAFSANLQAKVCAMSVARMLNDEEPTATTLANTCYSYITADQAISVVGVYRNDDDTLTSVESAGGISPEDASASIRELEARQASAWFDTITQEAFG
tara:strand:+ start:36309 stop:37589 length:1281 start_codon:yes stop_codon:yes gene_type:complete